MLHLNVSSSFSEAVLKRRPIATKPEMKQVISAQSTYAPGSADGGVRGNDGRGMNDWEKASGTSNSQQWKNWAT